MKLYLDTSNNQKTVVGLGEKRWEKKAREYQSQYLLDFIDEVLRKEKKSLKDLTAIEVNLGPGSFTGLRVGIAVANALGWALKIPINGQKVGQLVAPKYEGG